MLLHESITCSMIAAIVAARPWFLLLRRTRGTEFAAHWMHHRNMVSADIFNDAGRHEQSTDRSSERRSGLPRAGGDSRPAVYSSGSQSQHQDSPGGRRADLAGELRQRSADGWVLGDPGGPG